MNHLTEEQLILHYYGEEGDTLAAERHLDDCPECRAVYVSLQRVLNVVDSLPVPQRGPDYGSQVWQRIEGRVPARRRWFAIPRWQWAAASAVAALLVVAAFFAGRQFPGHGSELATADPQGSDRVLLVAVGDFLERSQMVLFELVNAESQGGLDITPEQQRAQDLIRESRLYRQTAAVKGRESMAGVLDELEGVLMEIAHSPSTMSAEAMAQLRERLRTEGILFRIRVLESNVRNRDPVEPGREVGNKL